MTAEKHDTWAEYAEHRDVISKVLEANPGAVLIVHDHEHTFEDMPEDTSEALREFNRRINAGEF